MTQVTNEVQSGSGVVATARRRRKKLTFDKVSFMAVFLGLPLAIYLVFVISPFVQAVYYSMTSWSGFDNNMPFVGLDNYVKLFNDDIFMMSVRNSMVLAIFLPVITVILSPDPGHAGHDWRQQPRTDQGPRGVPVSTALSPSSPTSSPPSSSASSGQQIYNPSNGLLNGILTGHRL